MPALTLWERNHAQGDALQGAISRSTVFSSIATDARGVIQIFNTGAERMLGYTSSEVVNTFTPADLSDPDDVTARAHALSAQLGFDVAPGFDALVYKASRGIEDQYELTYVRKDRTRFPASVSVTALRDATGSIIGYLLISSDLTARRKTETDRLAHDEQQVDQRFYKRALTESHIDALMTIDARGVLTDVDRQTEALTGRSREEMIGTPFADYFTDPSRAAAGLSRVLIEGVVTNFELTARALDGSLTIVSCNATAFGDGDRHLQGVFAAARDITALRRVELTLQQQNLELEDAVRVKDFLATMSHELRTPLNAIIGFSEVLRDGMLGTLTDEQQEFVGDIFGAGTHLLSLINDILDLSKVEAGKMQLHPESVSVSTMLASCLTIIREKAALRRIHLSVEVADTLTSMPVDVRKVKQIIYNLLSNAVNFCNDGGHVMLRAVRVARADVGGAGNPASWATRALPLPASPFTDFVEISVTDTGVGIPTDGLQHLFKSFSQLDGTTRKRFRGTGLGLSLVKLFAELHGGTVGVSSAVGAGSRFTVWLPIRVGDAEQAWVSQPGVSPPQPPSARSALIVAADPARTAVMRESLTAEQFAVLHATSVETGLALAAQHPLSILALDLAMMSSDGVRSFLAHFTGLPNPRRVPVVIIPDSDATSAAALGAATILQQPISRERLYETLVDLGLYPPIDGRPLTVLVAGADPGTVDAIASRILAFATVVHRAAAGRDTMDAARRLRPDLIVLDLGALFADDGDLGAALAAELETAQIPIVLVNPERGAGPPDGSGRLRRAATAAMPTLDGGRFSEAVRGAVVGPRVGA